MLKFEKILINCRIKEMMKMKAQIKNRVIMLPKKIIKNAHIPENGECEIIAEKDEIKILKSKTNKKKSRYRIVEDLTKPPVKMSINEMIKNELVNED